MRRRGDWRRGVVSFRARAVACGPIQRVRAAPHQLPNYLYGPFRSFLANVRDLTLVKISELCLIIVVLDSAASHSNTKRMRVAVLAVAGLISCAAAFALIPARSNCSSKLAA